MMKLILSLFLCISFTEISSRSLMDETLKVLIVTGVHDFDTTAFHQLFDSFSGMDCTIKEMGKDPGELFEQVEAFSYDVIVLYNFKQNLSTKHRENFKLILKKGVGLVVLHHAIAGFPNWHEFEELIGATYVLEEQTREGTFYPRPKWKHDVNMKINIEDSEHPITNDIEGFIIHDETYKDWIYHDGNHLLLSTDNQFSNEQIAWIRSSHSTNVFYLQLGHDKYAFENKQYRKLLKQGIEWTAAD